jgi:hypothetical protein
MIKSQVFGGYVRRTSATAKCSNDRPGDHANVLLAASPVKGYELAWPLNMRAPTVRARSSIITGVTCP